MKRFLITGVIWALLCIGIVYESRAQDIPNPAPSIEQTTNILNNTAEALDKASPAVDKAIDIVDKVAVAIQSAAEKHGDKVVQLTLESARILAIQDVVGSIGAALMSLVGLILCIWCGRVGLSARKTARERGDRWSDDGMVLQAIGVVGGILCSIALIISICCSMNVRSWVGMWHPDIYIASGIVKKYVD